MSRRDCESQTIQIRPDAPETLDLAQELNATETTLANLPKRLNLSPENAEQGLAQLALALIELLKRLMERQALRRMEAGSLTDEEIERIGETMMKLDARIDELCKAFNIDRRKLNIDLGPLGDLM
ncbi:MAG: gas vesicle protein K [Chloroherpetonaceae bacterium]|nr:gas vesicle protein K [Chloroherpetonaceae bacterium]MDW8438215.1 gas vesicle protein K [Chloroherpetonaceae bacterium]